MPDMDGYELIREIHALQPDLLILAQSGCQAAMGHATLRIAGLLGASRGLVKPYSLAELLERSISLSPQLLRLTELRAACPGDCLS